MKRKNEGPIDNLPDRLPSGKRQRSILVDETRGMAREQREAEQEGQRRLAKVHTREHPDEDVRPNTPDGEIQNNMAHHPDPIFNSQRFDGTDSTLNPAPDLNTEARLKYDNERREQEIEKQERLENALGLGKSKKPKFSPRPGGP